MEVHSPFHYSHHYQPRFYDHRAAPYPQYQSRMESPYAREAPPPPSYRHRRGPSSYSGNSSPRQAEPIKLPGISDLLNFSRDNDRQTPMSQSQQQTRPEPSWPRSAVPAPPLKVETSNIDPRLHKPSSPPHPGNSTSEARTSPLMPSSRQSPAYTHSAGPTSSAYPTSAYSEEAEQSKRFSLQSAHSVVSSRSSVSGGYPSPEAAKSSISMYPPIPPRRMSPVTPSGLAHQRPLPQDFPGPQATRVATPPQTHSQAAHPPPAAPQPMYVESRPAPPPHPYHVSPTMSHQSHQAPVSAPPTPSQATAMAPLSNQAPQLQDRYVCPSCSKAFSRPSSLRIHSHSHTGEKPFKCTRKGCGKAFSVRSNMKRHERGCHVDGSAPRGSSPRSMSGDA